MKRAIKNLYELTEALSCGWTPLLDGSNAIEAPFPGEGVIQVRPGTMKRARLKGLISDDGSHVARIGTLDPPSLFDVCYFMPQPRPMMREEAIYGARGGKPEPSDER